MDIIGSNFGPMDRNKDQEAVKDSQIRAQSIRTSMNQILEGSVKEYLDKRMFWFEVDLTDPRPDTSVKVIQLHSSKFDNLVDRLKECKDSIYTLLGYGEQYKALEALDRELRDIIGWLSEIECLALVDPAAVVQEFKNGELLYQRFLK